MIDGQKYFNIERFGHIQVLTPVDDIIDMMPDSITAEDFKEQADDRTNYTVIRNYYGGENRNKSYIVNIGVIRTEIMDYLNKNTKPNHKYHFLSDIIDIESFKDAFDGNYDSAISNMIYAVKHPDGRRWHTANFRTRSEYSRGHRGDVFKLALPLTEDDNILSEARSKKRAEKQRIKDLYKEGLTKDEITELWNHVMWMVNRCLDKTPLHSSGNEYTMVETLDFLKKKRLITYKEFNEMLNGYGRHDKKFKARCRKMYRNPEKYVFDQVRRFYIGNDFIEEHMVAGKIIKKLKNGKLVIDESKPVV